MGMLMACGGVSEKPLYPFEVKVTTPNFATSTLSVYDGGTPVITDNGDGTFQFVAGEGTSRFAFNSFKSSITKVELISANNSLTDMQLAFADMVNLTELIVHETFDMSGVVNFYATWLRCNKLNIFPINLDVSGGTTFDYCWKGCISLPLCPPVTIPANASTVDTCA